MSGHGQFLLSLALSLLLVGSLVGFFGLSRRAEDHSRVAAQPQGESQAMEREQGSSPAEGNKTAGAQKETAEEKPIEEVLLESGEDPEAVFYMSRVREALNEGNPTFARELLRQMKEEHEKSILVEEAERLIEEKGRKP